LARRGERDRPEAHASFAFAVGVFGAVFEGPIGLQRRRGEAAVKADHVGHWAADPRRVLGDVSVWIDPRHPCRRRVIAAVCRFLPDPRHALSVECDPERQDEAIGDRAYATATIDLRHFA